MVNNGKPEGTQTSGVDRRSFLKATGAGSAAVALAGCTETISGGGGGIPDTITVGAMGPADAPFGASILNSAELAAEEMNANGGIGGADVEILTRDTMDSPSTARTGYQELTTSENVDATVGIFGSEQLLALMPEIASAETVHMTAGAATPEAALQVKDDYETNKYWFRVGPVNATFLLDAMVLYAEDRFEQMGWESVAVVAEDFEWTTSITGGIESRLSDLGIEVTDVRRVASGTQDFTPVWDQLEASGVDGAFTALAHIGTNALVQWAQQQRPFGFGGIHVPTQLPSFYEATSGAAISTFSQTTATATSEITDKTVPYAEAYAEANDGSYPVYSGYSAYDAMYMLKQAIESAESVDSDDIVSELESMEYTGTAGNIAFYGQDDEYPHDVRFGEDYTTGVFFQWQADSDGNGVQEVIWPDSLTTSEYVPAPWNQ